MTGFLRGDRNSVSAQNFQKQVLVACGAASLALFFALVFYLRQVTVAGSPQGYLYLEVGGTLLSFFYAAIALVRFRGTHDRTALILAFGFVLSGIIETVSYFGIPGYSYEGYDYNGMFAWFSFKDPFVRLHVRPPAIVRHKDALERHRTTKAVVSFPVEKPIPKALVRKLVKASWQSMKAISV